MGDFNAKVGKRSPWQERCVGSHGLGERNDRRQTLVDFATALKMKIQNTYFKKRTEGKWTWRSPNGEYYNQIDYIQQEHLNT